MNLTGKNIIGSNRSSANVTTFQAVDPAKGSGIPPVFFEATAAEVDLAASRAAEAFQVYRKKSAEEKAAFLELIADEILAIGDALIERCMLETALPEARLKGERMRTVNQLRLFASYLREGSWVDARIDTADPSRTPPKPDVRSMQVPLGPAGIFGASNFPLAFSVAGGDTASALAAGCPVVFKAHQAHPGTSELVGEAIARAVSKARMPEGTFSMIHGFSTEPGMALVRHPLITAVGFTGSFRGGKALYDAACSRPVPIPLYAEMGSTNPVFILPGILREKGEQIAKDLCASVTLGVGQFCTNPGLVFVPKEEGFLQKLSAAVAESTCGTMLTPGISDAFRKGIARLEKSAGVRLLGSGGSSADGQQVSPAIFVTTGENFLAQPEMEEEVFGPSSLAVTMNGDEDLVKIARKLGGHLTATVHGTEEDLRNHAELISILEQKAGRVIINGYPTGVEVTHAMVHGGPFPATTDSRTTSVGTNAILRFTRPVCYQNFPQSLLPAALRDDNPLNIPRRVNGEIVLPARN